MSKPLFKFCFWLLFVFSYTEFVPAQSKFYYFKQLGTKEGLSQSKVQCILNDHKGYLWIGTESGLNCYDRDHLKQYLHHSDDDTSLPSNDIIFVAEDSLLNLWVGTKAGLCLYDRAKDCFSFPTINGNKLTVAASYLLLDDGIVFGTGGALYKYQYATKQWTTLYLAQSSGFYPTFRKMIRYDDKHVLLNTQWYGIYKFNLETNRVEKLENFTEKNYTSIYLDSHKRLWVSVYGNGLYCYENDTLLKHFTTANSPLTYNVVQDITEKDNVLWVATDGGGINLISLDDFSFSSIRQMQDDVHSFPANTIYRLYRDPANNMWAGSIRRGLIGVRDVYARSYENVPFGNFYGLSNQTVNRIFQDSDGMIWVGTDGGGINRFDPSTGTFKHFPTTMHEKVVSILEYTPRELLFFSFDKGFFIFNKQTGQMRPFIIMNPEMNSTTCIDGYTVNAKRIGEDKILFSAQHIFVYDMITKKFDIVATMGKEYERNSPLIIGTKGTKTYLLDLKNICVYDSSEKSFKTIYRGGTPINDACMDENGIFWLAAENGLVSYNPVSGKADLIRTTLFNEATSVVADRKGRIWVGTRRHLYVYYLNSQNFITLDDVDGVLPNEYLLHSTLLAKNGDVYMGGATGLTVISGDLHFEAEVGRTIEVLDVLLNGIPVSLDEDASYKVETVEVPWNFSSLQLKVLLNEKDVFRKNIFRFNIEGSGQKLAQSQTNSVVINYLPVGEYVLTASYYARNGEWSPVQKVLHIIVCPPWWKTGWFYTALCLLIGILGFYVVYTIYRKRRVKQYREIARLKNKMYEEKINFLTNISHELRTPLTLICAPLKRIISHEIRREEVDIQLNSIYKQANGMKSIIDMVLDVRKLEEGKDMLHILSESLNDWVRTVGEKFTVEFEVKGIALEYDLDEKLGNVPFDKSKCEFVLSNFLMNALKFSEAGTVTKIITRLSDDKEWARVAVCDQGMGLNMVDTDSLFSNFYQSSHNKGGSGIGLSYAKNLIIHHKGRIGVVNNQEQGATFYFELPLTLEESGMSKLSVDTPSADTVARETEYTDFSFLNSYSVIIVEDTPDLRNYLKDTLSGYFAKVYVAKDGKDGLEQIKQRLPDIIISDVMMPRMNGFELCKEVKTDLSISHIPFILLTAYHNSQNMNTGYKTGADAFLPKPFEIDGLLALITNQLKLREQIKSRYQDDKLVTYKDMSFSNADETFLLKLNALITDNLSNPELDVAFLATNMYISRSLLFNKVKALTGMGIIDYVNKMRIEKAVVLLTTSSMNITEISEVVGFSSQRYFSKVFKSIKGEIPSAFKKQL